MRSAEPMRTCSVPQKPRGRISAPVAAARRGVVATMALALLGAAPAFAQRARGSEPGGLLGVPGDDLRETITLLMMVRMKSEVGLSKDQYERILPKIENLEQTRQSGFRQRRVLIGRVDELLSGDGKDPEVLAAVDKLAALEEAEHRREESFVAEVRKLLAPRQQGQFMLFRQRFRIWLENRMRDARELRNEGPRGPLGGGPRRPPGPEDEDPPRDRP